MKTLVRNSRGRFIYTGQVARSTFTAWAQSTDGRALLEQIGSELRFAFFGRTNAARGRVWRQLRRAIRGALASVLQREVDLTLERLDPIVFAQDLPRISVDLRRLVVVPRLFVNAEAYRGISAAIRNEPVLTTPPEAVSLSEWFIFALIEAMEAAVMREQPSVPRPLRAAGSWLIVGINQKFEWRVPFEGPAWPGHYYALEQTAQPISRAVRKAVEKAIAELEQALPSLPRNRRSEIIRQATLSLDHLLGRDRRLVASR